MQNQTSNHSSKEEHSTDRLHLRQSQGKRMESVYRRMQKGPVAYYQVMGRRCIQGFVSLTDNVDRSFVVYEGSHLFHEHYMETYGYTGKNNWRVIRPEYLEGIVPKVLTVRAGDMVLWDSRTFHQNQYGNQPEERLVSMFVFLPRYGPGNTVGQQSLRRKYYRKRRTTSHWPYPIQGVPYHPDEPLEVARADLSEYEEEIRKII
jgi:ectoine hydroxylase-related dioxygenase (phytanoyl-CoA dioxygenase family)